MPPGPFVNGSKADFFGDHVIFMGESTIEEEIYRGVNS